MACRDTSHHAEDVLAHGLAAAMVQWPCRHLLTEGAREILQSRDAWLAILRTNAIFRGDAAERRGLARALVEYKNQPRIKELRLTVPVPVALVLLQILNFGEGPHGGMHWESLLTQRRPWPLTLPPAVKAQMQRQGSTNPITIDVRIPPHLVPAERCGPSWELLVQSDSDDLRNWHNTLRDSFRVGASQDPSAMETWLAAAAREQEVNK